MDSVCIGVPLCGGTSEILAVVPENRTRIFRQIFSCCMVLVLAAVAGLSTRLADAQGAVHFGYAQVTLGGGFNGPFGVAVDGSRNVYVADSNNNAVKEMTPGCVSSICVTTLGGGFSTPTSVAVDGSGDVYVADAGNSALKEMPPGCSSSACVVTLAGGPSSTFPVPNDIAVDASGNVYFTDGPAGHVYELPAGCNSVACLIALGGGFSLTEGIAVEGNGNVYVANLQLTPTNMAGVDEIPAGCISSTCVIPLGGGFHAPGGVAVDGNGNVVYVADYGVEEIPVGCTASSYNASTCTTTDLSDSPGSAIAVDGGGNVYVADQRGNAVYELMTQGVSFSPTPVGAVSSSIPVTFTFGTADTGITSSVVTQGATGLDFTNAGGGTCDTNGSGYQYYRSFSCTVNVSFTPTLSRVRYGAVVLTDASGASAIAYLDGTGLGPQVTFAPATRTTLGGGFLGPKGVATDGKGNIYVADPGNAALKEMPAGCASSSCIKQLGGGFTSPSDVAVDGAGNVYVTDYATKSVYELPPNCASSTCMTTLGGGFGSPLAVAVDGNGSVYVADPGNNAVYEMPPGCASSSCLTSLGGGIVGASGVAVDGSGNVYIAVPSTNSVLAMHANCVSSSCVSTIGGGFGAPSGVAVDTGGNIYIADTANNALKKMPMGCVSSSCVTAVAAGFSSLHGLVVDGSGNIYVADSGHTAVDAVIVSTAPVLSFANTLAGSTSSDSPKAVTLQNIGNAPLSFTAPASGTNPRVSANFSFGGGSSCPQIAASSNAAALASGTSCTLLLSFTPGTAGSPLSGTAMITDNNLNANPAANQTINMSGTATLVTPSLTFTPVPSASQVSGASFTVTATSNSSGAITYSVQSGPATISGSVVNLSAPGRVTLLASQAAAGIYAAATITISFTVTLPPSPVSLQFAITNLVYPLPPAFVVTIAPSGKVAPTGTVEVLDGTTVVGTYPVPASTAGHAFGLVLPPLNAGPHAMSAVYSGDSNYGPGTSSTVGVTVSPGPVTLRLSCSSARLSAGQSLSCQASALELIVPVSGTLGYSVNHGTSTSLPIRNGIAALTITNPPVGSDVLTLTWTAQGNYQAALPVSFSFTR